MRLSKEQITQARQTDLYEFLTAYRPEDYGVEGDSLRPLDNHSISIRRGYCGYKDFATGETGNSLDYLTRHCGYTFQDAVKELCTEAVTVTLPDRADTRNVAKQIIFPKMAQNNDRAIGYLRFRGITEDTTEMLINRGLVYQDADHSNIVFINKERDCAEVRGTIISNGTRYRRCFKTSADRFWWFEKPRKEPLERRKVFVCEGALDAISLYELRDREPGIYVSICGVTNYQAIDRIVRNGKEKNYDIHICVDNDDAGQLCRARYADVPAIIPNLKDWNEDLNKKSW